MPTGSRCDEERSQVPDNRPTLKQRLGCWLNERWRTELVLRAPRIARRMRLTWLDLCNRHERLGRTLDDARECLWKDSSMLTVARVFPGTGGQLLRHCLSEWPICVDDAPRLGADQPRISVVLPVAGKDRIPLFQFILRALFGQTLEAFEVIVVEHAEVPCYRDACPPSVRYSFVERRNDQEFSRSMAFNVGAEQATAPYVLLHDADIVPPAKYLASITAKLAAGWEAMRPIRFLFLLDRNASAQWITANGESMPSQVENVQQNFSGGMVAINRDSYWSIGGHDERFYGWGGEDTEFLDRLNTLRVFPGAYMPAIHLWHPPAPKKADGDRNREVFHELMRQPAADRIRSLRSAMLAERQ